MEYRIWESSKFFNFRRIRKKREIKVFLVPDHIFYLVWCLYDDFWMISSAKLWTSNKIPMKRADKIIHIRATFIIVSHPFVVYNLIVLFFYHVSNSLWKRISTYKHKYQIILCNHYVTPYYQYH